MKPTPEGQPRVYLLHGINVYDMTLSALISLHVKQMPAVCILSGIPLVVAQTVFQLFYYISSM